MTFRSVLKRLGLTMGAIAALAFALACVRHGAHRLESARAKQNAAPHYEAVAGLGPANLHLGTPTPHSRRILLDRPTLDRLAEAARKRTPAFQNLLQRCNEAMERPIDSGYQGFEWADAVASLALAWHATGDPQYASIAIRYVNALLEDRYAVGDGKGGEKVVTYDDGYGIRTFGAYSALAYDWLRDAPDMTPELRAHILARLGQWLDWYARDGYLRDRPTANYYWGYLTALSFGGLAASGESEQADGWLAKARDEWSKRVLPAFREELKGGGWPEGWQYGEYTTAEIALVARAFATGANIDLVRHLPWLGETVTHHVHALLPDGRSVYDGGTWGEHPAKPSALALSAISVALDGVDEARVEEAHWMIAHALPPLRREQAFIALLAEHPGAKERSPREGAPTSLHLQGQGLSFFRSDWSPSATWVSFQAGPPLAEDHQDADQGHFELVRGPDSLLVDGGDSEGSATINHNTLLIDDQGRHMNYPPNQGVWGKGVRTLFFGDDGAVASAVGDIGEAYAPSCAAEGCTKRSVKKAVRTLVYVRPSMLVMDDRVTLEEPEYAVAWAAHVTVPPTVDRNKASAVVGSSRVDIQTLEPDDAHAEALREPTPSGDGPHRADHPWGPMWRLEIRGTGGTVERGFLNVITADRADATPPPARSASGKGLRGAVVGTGARATAVLFADKDGAGEVQLGAPAGTVVVVGLTPGQRYRVSASGATCAVRLAAAADGVVANSGGFVRVATPGCGG
ncbi:MAG TPA: heparinase II/III family protein [Polyangiaceae bacterium]|nr:heparinase II/III family protein [Polyangiaceae bacterium]